MELSILEIIWNHWITTLSIRAVPTVCAEVVVEDLEEGEGVPGVGVLEPEHSVHVHREQGPEELAVLHQQVAEPREGLTREGSLLGDAGS